MHSRRQVRFRGVMIIAGLTSLSAPPAPAQTRPPDYPERPPAPAEQVARGQQIFRSNCSFCHGSDARGGESGPNLVRDQVVLRDQTASRFPIVARPAHSISWWATPRKGKRISTARGAARNATWPPEISRGSAAATNPRRFKT
ncbi:MAG: hypothetical protein DMD46_00405 [Gemmatimonadetes bacterium]|nr:MAG: hypothetical protein DMD46_00405 [Gemmatimonadota bacterium]